MVREYRWRLAVRSYESDAWGFVPASVVLRYLEQSAVVAAEDAGYDDAFHEQQGSAWVIRRMILLMQAPVRPGDELEITTWISQFGRVRGGREYRVSNAKTGQTAATGLAEWVYLNRVTFAPLAIPRQAAIDFDVPGAPLGSYDPPPIERTGTLVEATMQRTARWHESDSMAHVNNAVYLDWLTSAALEAVEQAGWSVTTLRERGLLLRGEHYNLDYRRSALPGDSLLVTTRIEGMQGRLWPIEQTVALTDGTPIMSASSIYGWWATSGEPVDAPE